MRGGQQFVHGKERDSKLECDRETLEEGERR